MASDENKLVVRLEAQMKSLENALKKAQGDTDRSMAAVKKSFESGERAAKKFDASIAAMNAASVLGKLTAGAEAMALRWAAAAVSIVGLVGAFREIRESVRAVDDMGDAAERLGVSTDFLQAFAFQLGQFGGKAEDAEGALDKFSNKIGEASKGSGDLAELFAANGVALRDQNGEMKSAEELLQSFAHLVANAGSAQERINLATEAFGRGAGPKMVGLMQQIDKVGFKTLIDDAEKAGAIISDLDVAKAGDLENEFQKFERAASNALKTIAIEAGPMALEVMKDIAAAAREIVATWSEWKAGGISIKYRNEGANSLSLEELQRWKKSLKPQQMWVENSDSGENITVPGTLPDDAEARLQKLLKEREDSAPKPTGPKTVIPKAKTGGSDTSDYERQKDAIEKKVEALEIEAHTLGMTEEAAARYRAEHELINAVLRDGKPLTDDQRAAIAATADAYAKATKTLEDHKQKLEAVKQAAEGLSGSFSTAFEDMLFEGKSLNDTMASLAKTIGKDLVHSLLTGQGAFAGLLGTTGQNGQAGGLLGSIFGALLGGHAAGGYITGPGSGTSDSIPARLSAGEFVINAAATKKARPLLERINAGRIPAFASGGFVGPVQRLALGGAVGDISRRLDGLAVGRDTTLRGLSSSVTVSDRSQIVMQNDFRGADPQAIAAMAMKIDRLEKAMKSMPDQLAYARATKPTRYR